MRILMFNIFFVDSKNHKHVYAKVYNNHLECGRLPVNQRYDVGYRLGSAYGMAGEQLGIFLAAKWAAQK